MVNSSAYLFANDTKIFRIDTDRKDQSVLQNYQDLMSTWSDTWFLRFLPDKCKHMHINKINIPTINNYYLRGKELETIELEKDIAVTIGHINIITKKGNSMFALLRKHSSLWAPHHLLCLPFQGETYWFCLFRLSVTLLS